MDRLEATTLDGVQIGLRLKALNRYAFKSEVFEGGYIYVLDDQGERKRLHSTGYFDLIELDPREYVLTVRNKRHVAVRDPVTALRLKAVAGEDDAPQLRKRPRVRVKSKDSEKPKEIQVGETSPDPEAEAGVQYTRDQLLEMLAAVDDQEDPLPEDVRDDAGEQGVEV